ncbi:MAG: DUF2165 domain-containing protein [Alphaproteobacteria bacterium]|nr:DUF2165 domain-containing protein [Alphaproteobacteria bacterium]
MSTVIICKILMLLSIALFFLLVGFDNVIDYQSNFSYVQHVLSMDTTFQSCSLMSRAIQNSSAHHLFYWIIIAWEFITAALCLAGSIVLMKHRKSASFHSAKPLGLIGLTAGFLLYVFAFITVGGEWFAMWQSSKWNGQEKSHIFMTMIGIVLIFLAMPED